MKTACFTGHRRISSENGILLPEKLDGAVDSAYQEGYRCFICGGALGFDTLAAQAVLRYRASHRDVMLHIAVPCADQDVRWSAGDRLVYRKILAEADQVTVLSDHFRTGCMQMRNCFMVDRSTLCICFWDGRRGGTSFTLRYALRRGLAVVNLAMNEQQLMREPSCFSTSISPSADQNAGTVRFHLSPGSRNLRKKTST